MKGNVDYSLYLCTDRGLMTSPTIEDSVEQALKGGATVIQLREKDCSSREFLALARTLLPLCRARRVPLLINDRVDIALAVDADGVHVGQSDLPCAAVRAIMGPDKIVGVSASSLEEAVQAQKDGADYLGVGAMYATSTKDDAEIVSMDELKAIRRTVDLPIVVIGGINARTIPNFKHMGIEGNAVVSALVAQADVEGAARALLKLWKD